MIRSFAFTTPGRLRSRYGILTVVTVLSTVLTYWYFKRRKWL